MSLDESPPPPPPLLLTRSCDLARCARQDNAFQETTDRIFAPDSQPDETKAEERNAQMRAMLEARQQREAQALALKMNANGGHVAGVPTALTMTAGEAITMDANGNPADGCATPRYVSEYSAAALTVTGSAPPDAPPTEMPNTVGMSRAAVLEAKRAWRLALSGKEGGGTTPRDGGCTPRGTVAGLTSEHPSRTVRGQVGTLDPTSAADYNYSVKMAKGAETPRSQAATIAPWLGGGAVKASPPPAAPLCDVSNHAPSLGLPPSAAPTPASTFAELPHAEKLRRMRELRQATIGGQM